VTGGCCFRPRNVERGFSAGGGVILLVVVLLYYPVGGWIVQNIDDDPQFAPRA